MSTNHYFYHANSNNLSFIPDNSVALIVTSPPYPMVPMWDQMFTQQDPTIDFTRPDDAFHKMHVILNNTWKEFDRILIDGGIVCINIGGSTRTFDNNYKMFPNCSEIVQYFCNNDNYNMLPYIIWSKPSNKPNNFLGSGMYPVHSYVTQEHEYILIFRKGNKRVFRDKSAEIRRNSAYFYEERNVWFSDLWNINGVTQKLNIEGARDRSGAYPFEIAYRLINMYSIKGDTVLDPFAGTETTTMACMASERNSISIDCEPLLQEFAFNKCCDSKNTINTYITKRIENHVKCAHENNYTLQNTYHDFNVKTNQETDLSIRKITDITAKDYVLNVEYENMKMH